MAGHIFWLCDRACRRTVFDCSCSCNVFDQDWRMANFGYCKSSCKGKIMLTVSNSDIALQSMVGEKEKLRPHGTPQYVYRARASSSETNLNMCDIGSLDPCFLQMCISQTLTSDSKFDCLSTALFCWLRFYWRRSQWFNYGTMESCKLWKKADR